MLGWGLFFGKCLGVVIVGSMLRLSPSLASTMRLVGVSAYTTLRPYLPLDAIGYQVLYWVSFCEKQWMRRFPPAATDQLVCYNDVHPSFMVRVKQVPNCAKRWVLFLPSSCIGADREELDRIAKAKWPERSRFHVLQCSITFRNQAGTTVQRSFALEAFAQVNWENNLLGLSFARYVLMHPDSHYGIKADDYDCMMSDPNATLNFLLPSLKTESCALHRGEAMILSAQPVFTKNNGEK